MIRFSIIHRPLTKAAEIQELPNLRLEEVITMALKDTERSMLDTALALRDTMTGVSGDTAGPIMVTDCQTLGQAGKPVKLNHLEEKGGIEEKVMLVLSETEKVVGFLPETGKRTREDRGMLTEKGK